MKRTLIVALAVLALAFTNPAATSADKPDSPGQSESAQSKSQDAQNKGSDCKKKGCGQPHGQSCKNPNPHKTWCGSGRDDDDDHDNGHDGNGHDDNGHDSTPALANTGA